MKYIISMLIGGMLAILGIYIYNTISDKIDHKKALKIRSEGKDSEQCITGSDGEQWGYCWAYKLPYPDRKDVRQSRDSILDDMIKKEAEIQFNDPCNYYPKWFIELGLHIKYDNKLK